MSERKPYFLKYNEKQNDFRITERSGFIKRVLNTYEDYIKHASDISLDDLEPKGEKARLFLELLQKEKILRRL